MPWWSWVLIWSLLGLGLVSVLGWFAVRLFRQAMSTLRALEALADQVTAIDRDLSSASRGFTPAIFSDVATLRSDIEHQRAERAYRRQQGRDALIARGKLKRNIR